MKSLVAFCCWSVCFLVDLSGCWIDVQHLLFAASLCCSDDISADRLQGTTKCPSTQANFVGRDIGKQVTWGHNIVADGWTGASNPQSHPNHTPTPLQHTHTQAIRTNCSILNTRFSDFQLDRDNSSVTDRRTNGQTKPLIELRVRN